MSEDKWSYFRNLIQREYDKIYENKEDWPFPYDKKEGHIWRQANLEVLQWVLEMMPSEE